MRGSQASIPTRHGGSFWKNRFGDVETDCRDRLHDWLLRIVGALTAPTFMALACRWRSRPQHQRRTWHHRKNCGSGAHLHYGAPMYEMLVVIGERPTTRQRLVGYRPEYILQPGEVTSHADNRLHDATGHYFHGFHKLGTRGMTRSCDDRLGLHKSSRIERKGL